jgi:hypothetical protein
MMIIFALIVGGAAGMRLNRALGKDPDWGRCVLLGIAGSLAGFIVLSLLSGDGMGLGPSALLGIVGGAILGLTFDPRLHATDRPDAPETKWSRPRS